MQITKKTEEMKQKAEEIMNNTKVTSVYYSINNDFVRKNKLKEEKLLIEELKNIKILVVDDVGSTYGDSQKFSSDLFKICQTDHSTCIFDR